MHDEPDTAEVLQDAVDDAKVVIHNHEVQAAAADIPEIISETRKGWKTTEFWLTIAGLLAVNLNGVVLTLPDKYQAIATAVIAGLYAISRGQAKAGIPHVEVKAEVPEA